MVTRSKNSKAEAFSFDDFTPDEAVAFYRGKTIGGKFAFDYRDVWQAEHAKSFVVAKAMTVDVLGDLHDAVDQAVADGIAFEDFRDNLTPILQAKGWWGKRFVTDPLTGREREVQLGSNRRLQIIYDTNLRTSYAAGDYEQSMRAAALLPYWRYVDPSEHPRPQHLEWSDTVLRKDDPWWADHLPPLAYNCHCYVDDLGESDLGDHPLTLAPASEYYDYENPRTLAHSRVPVGVDPSFAYDKRIGTGAGAERALAEKLATMSPELRKTADEELPAPPVRKMNLGLDETIAEGEKIIASLGGLPSPDDAAGIRAWRAQMYEALRRERNIGTVAPEFIGAGRGRRAELIRTAAAQYPDAWIAESNEIGRLRVRFSTDRGYHRRLATDAAGSFDSEIAVRQPSTAVHELGHRLQAVMPGLDQYFRELHPRRTEGDELESLARLQPRLRYRPNEVARPDKYADVYFGKEYPGMGPLEVLTMAMQGVLSGDRYTAGDGMLAESLLTEDPEMITLVVGLLFSYAP